MTPARHQAQPTDYAPALGLHRIVLMTEPADPLPNALAIDRWRDRMSRYESTLARSALAEIPDGYVKPYPLSGETPARKEIGLAIKMIAESP